MLGHFPADVETLLGEPLTKGSRSESCVRFVPKRVFFACESVSQTYADKTGAFRQVTVTYEDGVSTAVTFDGARGEGPFTADAAQHGPAPFDKPGFVPLASLSALLDPRGCPLTPSLLSRKLSKG